MGEGLLRQRRNLITVSVVLWLLKYGGVTVSKFELAGFDIVLKKPEAFILSIWIAFAYFLYRYYQYFADEGVEKLQKVFAASIERKCEPLIRSLVKKAHPTNNDAHLYSYAFLKRDGWLYKGHALGEGYDTATSSIPGNQYFELAIRRRQLWKGILLSMLDSIFRNSVVTDYLLPFAIAGFIIFYCGSNDWNGSFVQFLAS